MKKLLSTLAVALIFIVSLAGNAAAMIRPYDFVRPDIGSDDHTWGGDQGSGPGSVRTEPGGPTGTLLSGVKPWDVFSGLITGWWLPTVTISGDTMEANPATDEPVHYGQGSNREAIPNNKGN